MKLLIIEDFPRLLRSLGTGLRKMGYAVDLVADGAEGLDYARLNDYDVIVLDLMLPTMDGLTVLQRLRALGKQTHVLILTLGLGWRVNGNLRIEQGATCRSDHTWQFVFAWEWSFGGD